MIITTLVHKQLVWLLPPNLSPFHRAKPLIPRWITSYLIVITFIWQVSTYIVYQEWFEVLLSVATNVLLPSLPHPPGYQCWFLEIIKVVVDAMKLMLLKLTFQ